MLTVEVDPQVCNGCGLCETMCPEVFALVGDQAQVRVNRVPEEVENACLEAAELCPVSAIAVRRHVEPVR
ncbi:MAG: ferredoxin [Kiritimatiellae bacterium]|nr:ferredoxin [Kiritimatiellia bacterium]